MVTGDSPPSLPTSPGKCSGGVTSAAASPASNTMSTGPGDQRRRRDPDGVPPLGVTHEGGRVAVRVERHGRCRRRTAGHPEASPRPPVAGRSPWRSDPASGRSHRPRLEREGLGHPHPDAAALGTLPGIDADAEDAVVVDLTRCGTPRPNHPRPRSGPQGRTPSRCPRRSRRSGPGGAPAGAQFGSSVMRGVGHGQLDGCLGDRDRVRCCARCAARRPPRRRPPDRSRPAPARRP